MRRSVPKNNIEGSLNAIVKRGYRVLISDTMEKEWFKELVHD
jgi:hypothetical protein